MKLANYRSASWPRLLTLIVMILASASLYAGDINNGIVGKWNLSISTEDLSGKEHVATFRNNDGGKSNIRFDGQTLLTIAALDSEALGMAQTMSVWINPITINRQSIIGKPRSADGWNTPRKGLFFSDFGTAALAYWDVKNPNAGVNAAVTGKTSISTQTWTLITTSYDGQEIKIYVNGKLDAVKSWNKGLGWNTAPMRVGTIREFDPYFKGAIGEVRFYDRALSEDEVVSLYHDGRAKHPTSASVQLPKSPSINMQARRNARDKEWETFPATTLDELKDFQRTGGPSLDIYGGLTNKKSQAKGFFYTKKIDGRWWLIDPLGGYFIHAGVVAVAPGTSDKLKANLSARFGNTQNWTEETVSMLKQNGFNGAGAWSEVKTLRQAKDKVAYTVMLDFLSDFAKERKLTQHADGHTGYIQDSLPVFLPDFEAYCQKYAIDHLTEYRNDPWMLGVFSDNELLTPNLSKYLSLDKNDPLQAANYEAAAHWLSQKLNKTTVTANDVTWDLDMEFQGYVFDHYFSIVSKAVKAVLPEHLYLGSRLNTERDKINPHTWRAAGKYVDVIALNLYRTWTPDLELANKWSEWSGKPVIITEWYVKADDAGFSNTSGAGWIVPTQEERGKFYQQFTINLLKSKSIVGWHWFKYMDNDPNDLKADSSNRDSNKGMVQLSYAPYTAMVKKMQELNLEMYSLTDYFDKK